MNATELPDNNASDEAFSLQVKWGIIRTLLTPSEYRLFVEALITYKYTLEAMAKTGKYDDWVPATIKDVAVLQELFRRKEIESHGVNKS